MMTHEQVIEMIEDMELPFAYDHFAEGESPDPPFICFLYPHSINFGADNIVYSEARELDIELYTDRKDTFCEQEVERVLQAHEIFWDKQETWIQSEKLYEVCYTIAV